MTWVWKYLRHVKNLYSKLDKFWQKRLKRNKYIFTDGDVTLLSCQPEVFLKPLAAKRSIDLCANKYDVETAAFIDWCDYSALYNRCREVDTIYDRLNSPLKKTAQKANFVPARSGKTFKSAFHYRVYLCLVFVYMFAIMVLAGTALGIVSLYFATAQYGLAMFKSYFTTDMVIFLNVLPIVLAIILLYFIFGRLWVSFTITSILTVSMTLINYFKIAFRNDPFIAEDVTLFFEAAEMGQQYHIAFTLKTYVYIACCIAGIIFCVLFAKGRLRSSHLRLLGAVSTVAVMVFCFTNFYMSDNIYDNVTRNEALISKWSSNQVFFSKGFIYPFIHSIKDNIDTSPPGYNQKEAEAALMSYEYSNIPENQKVNIISIMLEAYSDFSEFDQIEFNIDVYEKLHALEAESWSGTLINNIFAGGTIDTERSFITGFTELGSFRQLTNSYVYYLREQGYYTEGTHGCYAWFYNRENINENLGFENYYFVENYYAEDTGGGVAYDNLFIPSIIDLYEEHRTQSDQPYFSFNVSYQGHGPYDTESTVDTQYIINKGYSDAEYNILNNYFASIYDTNEHLWELFNYFRDCNDPVVLVVFGDHKPWLGDGSYVYNDLGINLDPGTEDGFYNYYSTPYLIWANDAAKTALGTDLVGDGGSFSPCFLMQEMFSQFGWGGNEFMKASADLRTRMDVVNTTGIYRVNGELTMELSDEDSHYLNEYRKLEYYWKKNFRRVS